MADPQHSTPAPSANPTPFDAAQWLSHFESIGGGFLATDSQTSLCIAYQGNTAKNQGVAHAMLRDLTDGQRTVVLAHIRACAGLSAQQPDLNAIPLEKLSEAAGTAPSSSGSALDQSEGSHDMDMTHSFDPVTANTEPAGWDQVFAAYSPCGAGLPTWRAEGWRRSCLASLLVHKVQAPHMRMNRREIMRAIIECRRAAAACAVDLIARTSGEGRAQATGAALEGLSHLRPP